MQAGRPDNGPTVLMGDNDQATKWSIEDMKTTPFKRVRNDYHWVKEAVEYGEICPRRIATADNIADLFTKSLGNQLVEKFRDQMCGYEELPKSQNRGHDETEATISQLSRTTSGVEIGGA